MFDLVRDVRAYPEFLSWCVETELIEESESGMSASLTINIAGVRQTFSTRNRHQPGEQIDIELLDGPFTRLDGTWHFEQIESLGSKVELVLDFEFRSRLLGAAFRRGFEKVADRLVSDFSVRAETIYE